MNRPVLAGVHHVKIPVTDLPRSIEWYGRVLDFTPTLEFPDADGVVLGVASTVPGFGDTLLGLRVNPQAAAGCRDFDPIGFAVADHADVKAWAAHGFDHSDRPGYGRPVRPE